MKKIISLVLALLMLSALGISAAAAPAYDVYPDGFVLRPEPKPSCPDHKTTVVCTTCGESKNLAYRETITYCSVLYDVYFCPYCMNFTYVQRDPAPYIPPYTPSTPSTPWIDYSDLSDKIICSTKGCMKIASLTDLYVKNGVLYAEYKCTDGHVNVFAVGSDYSPYNPYYPSDKRVYSITVINTYGADYDIKGGSTAKYGEEKTVVFYAPTGYTLVEVTVNGYDVTIQNGNSIFLYGYFLP